jgi:hypothetical protein
MSSVRERLEREVYEKAYAEVENRPDPKAEAERIAAEEQAQQDRAERLRQNAVKHLTDQANGLRAQAGATRIAAVKARCTQLGWQYITRVLAGDRHGFNADQIASGEAHERLCAEMDD